MTCELLVAITNTCHVRFSCMHRNLQEGVSLATSIPIPKNRHYFPCIPRMMRLEEVCTEFPAPLKEDPRTFLCLLQPSPTKERVKD